MTEGGYYQQKRLSPTGVAVVVLLHGAALTALLTAKGIDFTGTKEPPLVVRIFKDPLPPPPKPAPPQPTPTHRSVIETVKPIVPTPQKPVTIDFKPFDRPPIPSSLAGNDTVVTPPPLPPLPVRDAVRSPAQIDGGSPLQPPYPASAQREGAEGLVEVKVTIGPDGRVKAVEKLRASRDDFYAATERQALRYWRFKPATVDGRPIESSKVMTVRFRLDDLG